MIYDNEDYDFKIEFSQQETSVDFIVSEFESGEKICEGFIKWDGCMEIQNLLNIHMCSHSDILQKIVDAIYLNASEIMIDTYDPDLWGYIKPVEL